MRVTMRHVRQARMCSHAVRIFFKQHNLDWDAFLREGIEPEKLVATGDALAIKVVKLAEVDNGR